MLSADADQQCGAGRYERSHPRQDTRIGSYDRSLRTRAGEVSLKVPKLRRYRAVFSAIRMPGCIARASVRRPRLLHSSSRREECVQMPAKMARSAPSITAFGLPEATAVVRGRQPVLPERGESAQILPKPGALGNLGIIA